MSSHWACPPFRADTSHVDTGDEFTKSIVLVASLNDEDVAMSVLGLDITKELASLLKRAGHSNTRH